MRSTLPLSLALVASLSCAAQAQTIPTSGRCVAPQGFIIDQVSWSSNGAEVTYLGQPVPAELRGMRPHDDGFRLSIIARHPIVDAIEIPIFFTPDQGSRMATVSYEDTADGRLLSYVTGYQPATCQFD